MGFGDVRTSVLPKPVLIGQPTQGGDLSVRYFTPLRCHTSLATTGAVSVAMAATLRDSLVGSGSPRLQASRPTLALEHPTGRMNVRVDIPEGATEPAVYVMRTCRRLFEGSVLARQRN